MSDQDHSEPRFMRGVKKGAQAIAMGAALAGAALAAAGPAQAQQAHNGGGVTRGEDGRAYANINGEQVYVAMSMTSLRPRDLDDMNRLKYQLEREVRRVDPLPYRTLTEIPDARDIGEGDCKSFSVAFRNMLISEMGWPSSTLHLASATTEDGQPHMVLLIEVREDNREKIYVFDIRVSEIVEISQLTEHGYRWSARESSMGSNVMLNFNGRTIY
jgi:predicted transglutaminase-like cysteine proteinase